MGTFAHFATNAIHSGQNPAQWRSRAVVPPIFSSASYQQSADSLAHAGYTRLGNPTRSCLQNCIASLCDAKHAFVFSAGLASIDAVCRLLHSGDHIVCSDDVYGGTHKYFRDIAVNFGLEVSFIDLSDATNLLPAMKDTTQLIWIESPTNPLLKVSDVTSLSSIAHKKNPQCLVAVDNTFATPYFHRPLSFGADIEMNSMSKFMNGHCDVLMGCLATNNDRLADLIHDIQTGIGAVPSPFDCYLANRGLKTLHIRMEAHLKNAMVVAEWLEKSPFVQSVRFPWLPSHPQHDVAVKQMKGCGGVVSFYVDGDREKGALKRAFLGMWLVDLAKVVPSIPNVEFWVGQVSSTSSHDGRFKQPQQTKMFMDGLKIITLGGSLGDVESLAQQPSLMSHALLHAETLESLGITDNLIRLSIGLENVQDLIDDLSQALEKAFA